MIIVYDGHCPFCSRYVQLLRLRETVGKVELIDARDGGPVVQALLDAGYDLNEGMVAQMNGATYHGADCIHFLALMTTSSGLFNRLNAAIFKHPRVASFLYPSMRAGRNAVLRVLGRDKLSSEPAAQ